MTDVRDVVDAGVADGTTPGAACLVLGKNARLVHTAGTLHRLAGAPAVTVDTVWDLASLTKLLSTTVLVARAVDAGKLALDERPWPRWPGVTVEHVLRHEAGLPPWLCLYDEARRRGVVGLPAGKELVVAKALAADVVDAPGVKTVYSDLGMIAVGALLEERCGAELDELFADLYPGTGLRFVRLDKDGFHPAVPRVAPTERCPWRKRAMHGQVHDENCFAMGGVSGHAGLFGSLLDVEQAVLGLQKLPGRLREFARVPDGTRRPIGFDRTTPGGSTGDALSSSAVGHLAFTGCSLWLDGDNAYVLLTNRIHESREGPDKILALRRSFHRAAAAWLGA